MSVPPQDPGRKRVADQEKKLMEMKDVTRIHCCNLHGIFFFKILFQEHLERAERNVAPKKMPVPPAVVEPTGVNPPSPVAAKALPPETSTPPSGGPGHCKVTAHQAAQGMWIYRLG